MNDLKKFINTNKIFDPSIESNTRNIFSGLAVFCLGFSTTYFAQKVVRRRISYSTKLSILLSTLIASSAAYIITKDSLDNFKQVTSRTQDK